LGILIIDKILINHYYLNMNKLQISLTDQENDILAAKAAQLGYSVTKYVKLLLGKTVLENIESADYPTFQLSKKVQKEVEKAHQEYLRGEAKELKSVDDLDDLL
jgi:hypothetical protein